MNLSLGLTLGTLVSGVEPLQFPADTWTVAADWTLTDTADGLELTRGSGSATNGCTNTFSVEIGVDYLINFTGGAGLASFFSGAASYGGAVRAGAQSLPFTATTTTLNLAFWGGVGTPTAIDGLEVVPA